jgi:serine/threonine protein kinase
VLYTYEPCPQHPKEFQFRFLLVDIGLSRPIDDDENGAHEERFDAGSYRAPEGLDGKFGKRTDMFSFGCVMFDVASMGIQRAPRNDYEIRRYTDRDPEYPLRQLKARWNPGLDNSTLTGFNVWIFECLNLDPSRRPKAADLMEHMENLKKLTEAYL